MEEDTNSIHPERKKNKLLLTVFITITVTLAAVSVLAMIFPKEVASMITGFSSINPKTTKNTNSVTPQTIQPKQSTSPEPISSSFTYSDNKYAPIISNASGKQIEGDAVSQWDNAVTAMDDYSATVKIFSLHPTISGTITQQQFLDMTVASKVPFDTLSPEELNTVFTDCMVLEGYIGPKLSAVISAGDPKGNKISFNVYAWPSGSSLLLLAEKGTQQQTIWQTIVSLNETEATLEDFAKQEKNTGQSLYNFFHGSTSTNQTQLSSLNTDAMPNSDTASEPPIDVPQQLSPQNTTIALPDVIGRTLEEARSILEDQNHIVMSVDYNYSDTCPKGTVIDMSPEPGEQVQPNGYNAEPTFVDITVSDGPYPTQSTSQDTAITQPVVLPNVIGKTVDEALAILKEQNIPAEVDYIPTAPGPSGIVVDMSPSAGTPAEPIGNGVDVILYVSGSAN